VSEAKRQIRVVSAEIKREGCYLITRRPPNAVLPGLWEFPGGRVRAGESDADALKRSLVQRIGCSGEVGESLLQVEHSYDGYDLVMGVYPVDLGGLEPVVGSVAELAWVALEELSQREFPGADQQTVDLLLQSDD